MNCRPPTGGYESDALYVDVSINSQINFLPLADFSSFSLLIASAFTANSSVYTNSKGEILTYVLSCSMNCATAFYHLD